MSESDRDKWSKRYAEPAPVGEPDPFVREGVPPSTSIRQAALDVAGGTGRHALLLAERGYRSTLVDIAPAALGRAENEARQRGLELTVHALDLDEVSLPPGPFAVVVIAWYLLPDVHWRGLRKRLDPGGRLIYVHPTEINLERHAKPSARWLVASKRLPRQAESAGLQVLRYEESWLHHHTARLIAIRET